MRYQVVVSGSVWLETQDELLAGAYAHHVRASGWKDVKVETV